MFMVNKRFIYITREKPV